MPQLEINDRLIADLIEQIAPLVAQATGWDLKPADLRTRVVPKNRGFEEIVMARLQALGAEHCFNDKNSLAERFMAYVIEGSLLAAYLPASQELLVVRENLDDSNLDGLRLVLAHELVHRAQHVNHPKLFEQIDHLTRLALCAYFQSPGSLSLHEFIQTLTEIRTMMTLVESHAVFIQNVLAKSHFRQAQIEAHFSLPVLLFRLLGQEKISQYTDGLPAIAEAAAAGNVDMLFRSPGKFTETSG